MNLDDFLPKAQEIDLDTNVERKTKISDNNEPQQLPLIEINEWQKQDHTSAIFNTPEEDSPFGCKNSWIIKIKPQYGIEDYFAKNFGEITITVHYCPLCDKLEVCADDVCDYDKGIFPCNFSTRYGFHPECYFKKPFLSTDGKQYFGDMTMAKFDQLMDNFNRKGKQYQSYW
jgi:hypothetical protein